MKRGGYNTAAKARYTCRKSSLSRPTGGFTIAEVLIVLAVTGAMFAWAVLLISGRQAKTEFQVGIRNVQTKLQQSINEVKSGYYPFDTGFTCIPGTGMGPLSIGSGGAGLGQGEHADCIFIGKTVAITSDTMYIYSLAGARLSTGSEVQTPVQSRATVIGPAAGPPSVNTHAPDLTTVVKLPSGITLVSAAQNGASLSPASTYAVAILTSFNSIVTTATASSGMQTFGLYGFDMSNFPANPTKEQIANAINRETGETVPYPPLQNVKFCLKSGTTNESVIITIGDNLNAQGTSVSSEYKSGPSC